MSDRCPTVKIKSDNESGHVIINESDFDETKHERVADEVPPLPPIPTEAV